jgi:hypothetical protein
VGEEENEMKISHLEDLHYSYSPKVQGDKIKAYGMSHQTGSIGKTCNLFSTISYFESRLGHIILTDFREFAQSLQANAAIVPEFKSQWLRFRSPQLNIHSSLYHRQHAPSATDRDRYVNHS